MARPVMGGAVAMTSEPKAATDRRDVSRKPRIASNIVFESSLAERIDLQCIVPREGAWTERLAYWRHAMRLWKQSDIVFLEAPHRELLSWCLIASLLRGFRCKLACADLNLPRPVSTRDLIVAAITRVLLQRVDLFLLLQKDFSDYQKYYGLKPERTIHVPFKTNHLDVVNALEPSEGDYYWSGGVTYRDWATLAQAVEGLDVKIVITVPEDEELRRRGESDSKKRRQRGVPPIVPRKEIFGASNVRIVRHCADPRSWLNWVAGARGVILPIHPRSISPSGVSTYLTAMALQKPLIISEGASTLGLLDETTALIVPPGDPDALRSTILRLDGSADLRRQLAHAGHRHALAAGDASRLHTDYLRHLLQLATRVASPTPARSS
ncbi:glycosyltransferase [Microvirga sp. TS319]|uniref:glycosyltransferase n=1 Tax=Microvirga sp. TS319 TaxID=3241165 RepID=UPI00351A3975